MQLQENVNHQATGRYAQEAMEEAYYWVGRELWCWNRSLLFSQMKIYDWDVWMKQKGDF
jgi:hypothetical protein